MQEWLNEYMGNLVKERSMVQSGEVKLPQPITEELALKAIENEIKEVERMMKAVEDREEYLRRNNINTDY